jgi:hypothetical protein
LDELQSTRPQVNPAPSQPGLKIGQPGPKIGQSDPTVFLFGQCGPKIGQCGPKIGHSAPKYIFSKKTIQVILLYDGIKMVYY